MSGDRHIDPTREALAGFRDLPANTPIEMLNLVQFRDRARYADDIRTQAEAGLAKRPTGPIRRPAGQSSPRLVDGSSGPLIPNLC